VVVVMSRRCLHKQSYQFYTRPAFNFPVDGLPVRITTSFHTITWPPLLLTSPTYHRMTAFSSIRYAINVQIEDANRRSLLATITSRVSEVASAGCLTHSQIEKYKGSKRTAKYLFVQVLCLYKQPSNMFGFTFVFG